MFLKLRSADVVLKRLHPCQSHIVRPWKHLAHSVGEYSEIHIVTPRHKPRLIINAIVVKPLLVLLDFLTGKPIEGHQLLDTLQGLDAPSSE